MSERPQPLRVLLLPSLPYEQARRLNLAGEHPRSMVTEELRRDHGIMVDSIDPDTGWKNPFGRKHPFLRAMDPLRVLRVLVARRDYDLVVSGNDGAAAPLTALRSLFRFSTPIVIWDSSPAARWRIRKITQDRIIPRSDGVIAVNDIQKPYIAARWGTHIPVLVVKHWVDTDFYRAAPYDPHGPILAVGDDDGRDYPTLLRALQGVEAPVSIRTSLPLDLNQHHRAVTILRERLSPVAFRQLYGASRFVVVPLKRDVVNASGNSTILEAAAMGKAVVVTDSDGTRGAVRHEETGLVVPADDPIALRAAISRLLADPEMARRLGENARRHAEQSASPAVFAARLADAFRALARGHRT